MSDCIHGLRCGGPSDNKEVCPTCGKEFMCHRLGSFDWDEKECPKCRAKTYVKHLGLDKALGSPKEKEDGSK